MSFIILFGGGDSGYGGDGMPNNRVRRAYEVLAESTRNATAHRPKDLDALVEAGLLRRGRRAEALRVLEKVEAARLPGSTPNDRTMAVVLDEAGLLRRWWQRW